MEQSTQKLGRVTVDDMLAQPEKTFKVYVNGVDVTNVSFVADDVEGYVLCYEWEGFPDPPPATGLVIKAPDLLARDHFKTFAWLSREIEMPKVRIKGEVVIQWH